MSLLRCAARSLIASSLLSSGIDVLKNTEAHTRIVEPLLSKLPWLANVPGTTNTYVRIGGVKLTVASALIGTGIAPRLGGLMAGAVLTPAVAAYLLPAASAADAESPTSAAPADRAARLAEAATTAGLLGAALLLVAWPRKRRPVPVAAGATSGTKRKRGCCKRRARQAQ
jgi:hypothetical protein